jgi:hypothetical protein
LHARGTTTIPLEQARAVIAQAFATWVGAACIGGAPRLVVRELAPVSCDVVEYNRETGNANVILFREQSWPYAGAQRSLALTTLTFDTRTGAILDADMEINATSVRLTTSDTDVEYDLRSILTHEAGHFIGLAHSTERGATMEASYTARSIAWRALAADDVSAVCAAYPPGVALDPTCDATPRRGLREACGRDRGGCSARGALGRQGDWPTAWSTAIVALAALLVGRKSWFQQRTELCEETRALQGERSKTGWRPVENDRRRKAMRIGGTATGGGESSSTTVR